MADDIQNGFSTMLESLPWLSLSVRKQARSKVESTVRNIGVPEFVLDDTKLGQYYDKFQFSNASDFISMVIDLKVFARQKQLEKLVYTGDIDRTEFLFNQYPVPIWSAYDLNSITFTLDILQEPLYSTKYPSAVNFGLLGSLIGE
jgi:predicted metalloendopeptidase